MGAHKIVDLGDPSSLKINKINDLVLGKGSILDIPAPRSIFQTILSFRQIPERPFTPGKDLAGVVCVGEDWNGFASNDGVTPSDEGISVCHAVVVVGSQ